jgi:hypothetical protein
VVQRYVCGTEVCGRVKKGNDWRVGGGRQCRGAHRGSSSASATVFATSFFCAAATDADTPPFFWFRRGANLPGAVGTLSGERKGRACAQELLISTWLTHDDLVLSGGTRLPHQVATSLCQRALLPLPGSKETKPQPRPQDKRTRRARGSPGAMAATGHEDCALVMR